MWPNSQGDRTKKVGVVDSEYIVHQGIQTLGGGGPPAKKVNAVYSLSLFLFLFSIFGKTMLYLMV